MLSNFASTAIRASQLGLKTAIIEKESLGGICLNWGCIPTKALLKSAQVFEYIKHAKDYGIEVGESHANFGAVIKRSRSVAEGMSKGVTFLMKKNKIDVINGYGKLKTGKKVEVTDAEGKKTDVEGKKIMINKKVNSVQEALQGIENGMTLMLGGFGLCGIPEN
eukprot:gene68589-93986_t